MTVSLRPSSVRKREAILTAAEKIFLRDGYAGANMDELAELAGVSKQTVYTHFGSKEDLFVALVTAMTTATGDDVDHDLPDPDTAAELSDFLQRHAERQLAKVMSPRILQLRRLVIGEVARFPQLARALWASGPTRAISAMAARFRRMDAAGWLHVEDPDTAAAFFNWIVMSKPLNEAMLLGDLAIPDQQALRRHSAEAVRIFLAAHRT